jgi:hypothetical protein
MLHRDASACMAFFESSFGARPVRPTRKTPLLGFFFVYVEE